MKYSILVLFSTIVFFSCITNDQFNNSEVQDRDNFITIEATAIKDSTNTEINTWYNDIYLSELMGYDGLNGAYRVKNLGGFNIDFVPGYWTVFMAETEDEILGLSGCSQVVKGNSDMTAKYPDSQIVRSWNVSYEKLKSWENEGAEKPLLYVTVIPTVANDEYETQVNDWEINTHVPWLMKYKGLSKVVRYKKVDGTGNDISQMPEYLEIFYYATKDGFDGQGTDENFIAAEADREETWKNGELDIPWVLSGQIVNEVK